MGSEPTNVYNATFCRLYDVRCTPGETLQYLEYRKLIATTLQPSASQSRTSMRTGCPRGTRPAHCARAMAHNLDSNRLRWRGHVHEHSVSVILRMNRRSRGWPRGVCIPWSLQCGV